MALDGTEILYVQAVSANGMPAATTEQTTTGAIAGLVMLGPIADAVFSGSSSGDTTLQASAVASGTLTLPAATDTLIGKATTDTLTHKTYDTAGTGNVFKINGTGISAVTGTGAVVLATSPTLVTPVIGVATATSVNKVAITAPATGATLAIADGKTLTVTDSMTLVKSATTGDVTGFVAGMGTPANDDSVYAGPTGSTAYTVGDIVKALKAVGILTA